MASEKGKGPFSIKLEDDVREEIEKLVEARKYLTVSEFVRRAIFEKLDREAEKERRANESRDLSELAQSEEIRKMVRELVDIEINRRYREIVGKPPG